MPSGQTPLLPIFSRPKFSSEGEYKLTLSSTRNYVAAAYASIFASTPPSDLQNRAIGISELQPTGRQIASALEKKHGTPPQVFYHSLEGIYNEIETRLKTGISPTLALLCRKIWGSGQQVKLVGEDIWDVQGYEKATLEDLIVKGKIEPYRDMPAEVMDELNAIFH